MDATLLYASNQMMNFLNNELGVVQDALQDLINGNTGTMTTHLGQSEYTNNTNTCLDSGNLCGAEEHPTANASSSLAVAVADYLNESMVSGGAGLAKMVADYIDGKVTQTDLINWIMSAYSDSLLSGTDDHNLFALFGLDPGTTLSGVDLASANLVAFNDENYTYDGWDGDWSSTYCQHWTGCFGVWGTNHDYQTYGEDFVNYSTSQFIWWGGEVIGWTFALPEQQDHLWIDLNFTTQNNNSSANVTTYQDLVIQLQGFQYDWTQNVMPSITNWVTQVANYQAQYDNWQIEKAKAIAEAQSTYSQGVSDLQSQESAWMASMTSIQNSAEKAFNAAENALRDAKGQSNYDSLYQQILAGLNKNNGIPNANAEASANLTSYTDALSNLSKGLNDKSTSGIPDSTLLTNFANSFSNLIAGASNLSLLSATNNSVVDSTANYMLGIVDSMKNEKTFKQNGVGRLLEANHIQTKEVDGETYVLDSHGQRIKVLDDNNEQKKDEDGNLVYKTIGDWIQEKCGADLGNGDCSKYVENKYSDVSYSNGTITATTKGFTGKTHLKAGGDATNYNDYIFDTEDKVVMIHAPKRVMMGRGISSLGNVFDQESNGVGDYISSSFRNLNSYLSNSKTSANLFSEVSALSLRNNSLSSMASENAMSQVKVANMVVDYVKTVLLGGATTGQWVTGQVNQAIQDVYATALVKAFDLDPQAASFVAGMYMANQEAHQARHEMNTQYGGLGWGVHKVEDAFNSAGLGALLDTMTYGATIADQMHNAENLQALDRWKNFKYDMAGFAVQKYGQEQGWDPQKIAVFSQFASDYLKMKDAKESFGMNGSEFSLHSIAGNLKFITSQIDGLFAETYEAGIKGVAHLGGELGAVGEQTENKIGEQVRYHTNDIKLKDIKDAIRNWKNDPPMIAGELMREYGQSQGWSDTQTTAMSKLVSDYMTREQAKHDLEGRTTRLGISTLLNPLASVAYLDQQLFNGGVTTLFAKGLRGAATGIADLGRGLGIASDDFVDNAYKESQNWSNYMTAADLKAKAHQGDINKNSIMANIRDQIFDQIGEELANQFGGDPHILGQLLKHHIDQQEAKKAAREQRLKDAELTVQVAAAAAMVYFSGGTASGQASSMLQQSFFNIARVTAEGTKIIFNISNGQALALGATTIAQTVIGSELGGTNGAIAGFTNGVLTAFTLGSNTPVTGFVTWTNHKNANIITGQQEVKGGWGGGVNINVVNPSSTLLSEIAASGYNMGFSFTPGSGLNVNAGLNFTGGQSVTLDYNLSSGNYTANYSADAWDSKNDKHHGGFSISASKDGSASLDTYYNYGNKAIPPQFRGHGGTLSFSNDGTMTMSGQVQGATAASLTYDTNTHSFGKLTGNQNFLGEFVQGLGAEHAQDNFTHAQYELLKPMAGMLVKMDLMTVEEAQGALGLSQRGEFKENNVNAEAILKTFENYKQVMKDRGLADAWADEIKAAGDSIGLKVEVAKGQSDKSTWDRLVSGVKGDFAQTFGLSNDGTNSVENNVFRTKTCFVAGTLVKTKSGYTPIEKLQIGDFVLSLNEETGELSYKKVTEKFIHEVHSVHELTYDNGNKITTTWNHPFYIRGTGWVQAENLSSHERSVTSRSIRNADLVSYKRSNVSAAIAGSRNTVQIENSWSEEYNGTLGIRSIEEKFHTEKVYNIEVEGNHTYFVSKDEVLVHNYADQLENSVSKAREDLADLQKANRKLFATDAIVEDRDLANKLGSLETKLNKFDEEGRRLEKDKKALLSTVDSAKGNLALIERKNSLLLDIIRSKDADNLSGIKEIREALKGVKPSEGFTKSHLEAIDKWVKGDILNNPIAKAGLKTGVSFDVSAMYRDRTVSDAKIYGLAWKAAMDVGSASDVAHARKTISDLEPKIRAKVSEIDKIGVDLAKEVNRTNGEIQAYLVDKQYGNAEFSKYFATRDLLKNESQYKKFDSETTYFKGEGKAKFESIKNDLTGLNKSDYLTAEQKKNFDGLVESREKVEAYDRIRREVAEVKSSKDPEYQKLKDKFSSQQEAYENAKSNADGLRQYIKQREELLSTGGAKLDSNAEIKALRSGLDKLETNVKTLSKSLKTAYGEMDARMQTIIKETSSLQAYGPEIAKQAKAKAMLKDPEYMKNQEEIASLKNRQDSSLSKLDDLMNGPDHTKNKLATLEQRNGEILKAYIKSEEKSFVEIRDGIGKEGMKHFDENLQKQLTELRTKVLNDSYNSVTGEFKGEFAKLNNPTPTEYTLKDAEFNFRFSEKVQPSEKHMDLYAKEIARDYTQKNGKVLSSDDVERIVKRSTASPEEMAGFSKGEFNPKNPEHVMKLADALVNPNHARQDQFGPLATQLGAVFDIIRSEAGGDKSKFQPDESIKNNPNALAEFNSVRDWIFSGKSPIEMGNTTSAALCRVYYNFAQTILTGKISADTNLATFMTHKIRIGGVSIGETNKAPVFDRGFTNGYTEHVTIPGLEGNNFEKFRFNSKGEPLGISGAISQEKVRGYLKDLPAGSVVQVFANTDTTPGPNHYFFIIKDVDGDWKNMNNNGGKAYYEPFDWKKNRIYGLYYDK
ncbi:TIGR04388 family protein [Leptospira andrefontaineae]|uniref:TIGR04388 family protein n=1 Tax=Leptospira andrefontaineae TaxID=2484976 RepID=A0A4R9H039_9LEPT|nr:TIGR04388 family protein [Leptospira andrefontaineae]TGK37651.1 TIGR04388 family protein [Leptospira andrefontaineae]